MDASRILRMPRRCRVCIIYPNAPRSCRFFPLGSFFFSHAWFLLTIPRVLSTFPLFCFRFGAH